MYRALLLAHLIGSFLWADSLRAQVVETFNINCPTGLNTRFNDYQPVEHDGAYFWSEWMAEVQTGYPLPSYAWYRASPNSTLISQDGGLRWYDARIQVHCFATRSLLATVLHYHQVGSTGRTEIIQCKSSGGSSTPIDPFQNDPYNTEYDPYTSAGSYTDTSECTGNSPDGGGDCQQVFVTVEVSYDGGNTWETWWEGWATVCQ
jgi:hypothetical protein